MDMNPKEVATCLRQLADELDPPKPVAKPTFKATMRQVDDPEDLLDTENSKGYSLRQCLNSMLKKWETREPGWSIEDGLARQARGFGIPLVVLHQAISQDLSLHRRFSRWQESGYLGDDD